MYLYLLLARLCWRASGNPPHPLYSLPAAVHLRRAWLEQALETHQPRLCPVSFPYRRSFSRMKAFRHKRFFTSYEMYVIAAEKVTGFIHFLNPCRFLVGNE